MLLLPYDLTSYYSNHLCHFFLSLSVSLKTPLYFKLPALYLVSIKAFLYTQIGTLPLTLKSALYLFIDGERKVHWVRIGV